MSKVFQKIINDTSFTNNIEKKINSIMKDNKIDSKDIPDITLLIIECSTNLKKFKVSRNELPILLSSLIDYILDKYNLITENQEEDFKKMTANIIKLVMLKPKVNKCLKIFNL